MAETASEVWTASETVGQKTCAFGSSTTFRGLETKKQMQTCAPKWRRTHIVNGSTHVIVFGRCSFVFLRKLKTIRKDIPNRIIATQTCTSRDTEKSYDEWNMDNKTRKGDPTFIV